MKGDAKVAGIVHPQSRKAEQIARAERREHNKGVRGRAKDIHKWEEAALFRWLQLELQTDLYADKTALSYLDVVELLTRFINRFDDELQDLERDPQPANSNHALELKLHLASEQEKLRTGYSCPDLRQKKVVTRLREWDPQNVKELPGFVMYKFKSKSAAEAMEVE